MAAFRPGAEALRQGRLVTFPTHGTLIAGPVFAVGMPTGGMNYVCPKDGNPLFITFRLADANDRLLRKVNCPACKTQYEVELSIREAAVNGP